MSGERNFTPGGSAHQILRRIHARPATLDEITSALGYGADISKTQRTRIQRILNVLAGDRCVTTRGMNIGILPAGQVLFADLEARCPGGEGAPSVRIFGRRAA